MPHLLVAISGHGFGHVAQTAPVINELWRRNPALQVTIFSPLPQALLAARFNGAWTRYTSAPDIGVHMRNALEVAVPPTLHAYRELHKNWSEVLDEQSALITKLAPDAVFANIPYATLAAAARLKIPAIGLCSLNWADIFGHFSHGEISAQNIRKQILTAYNDADVFLRPDPSMPMPDLAHTRHVGPIAARGTDRRADITRRWGLAADEKLVVVSMGGVALELNTERWPCIAGVRWIMPHSAPTSRSDMLTLERLGLSFTDVLRSSDVLLTKPGYGSFVEAACNGTAVLYTPRLDWPEEPVLVEWLRRHGRCACVSRDALVSGDFVKPLTWLLSEPAPAPVEPAGIRQAADIMELVMEK